MTIVIFLLGQLIVFKNELDAPEFNINLIKEDTITNAINITENFIKFNIPFITSKIIIGDRVENTDIQVNNIGMMPVINIRELPLDKIENKILTKNRST